MDIMKCAAMAAVMMISGYGCAARHYDRTVGGKLEGDLIVLWRKPNRFVYIPSSENPLKFIRGTDGDVIQPDRMWTDGGSIPRPFWVFKNFSPWGYGPAFIVHDWLFHMQDCELPGHEKYDFKDSAIIMSEVMKTLLENPDFDYGDKKSMYLMYKAVLTEPARKSWNDRNCVPEDESVKWEAMDAVFYLSY
jgi:hypothetical protein